MTDQNDPELESLLEQLLSKLADIDRSEEIAMKKRIQKIVEQSCQDEFHGMGREYDSSDNYELLIRKEKKLKIKMYQEAGHQIPHIHIDDLTGQNHIASFAIDPPKKLVGNIKKKYEKEIIKWLHSNKESLINIWNRLQIGDLTAKKDSEKNSINSIITCKISSIF